MEEFKNEICRRIAHWLPKRLLYFCIIEAWAYATTRKEYSHLTPDEVTWSMVCKLVENKFRNNK